jgi:hypothetical protein
MKKDLGLGDFPIFIEHNYEERSEKSKRRFVFNVMLITLERFHQ